MADLRIMVFDRLDRYLFDIDLGQVRDATYVEAINGEHSVTITTTQTLEKTNRLLMRDGMGIWHEYVVLGIEEAHDAMEYYCIWSMQYDLMGTFINGPYDCGIVPGHASVPQYPRRALEVSLGDTSRWEIGTITVTSMAAASFYRRSGWEGLKTVLEKWGGELQATITVGQSGVISRAVDLLEHIGTSDATRRFDYGFDLKGIKRTISDDIWPCRIVPLGKSQQTENGGYTRRPDIGSVNNGVLWLQDDSVVEEVRILNPDGEYEYPTKIIENDTYEEPAEVKAWALEHITEYTRPKVTYEASVMQFEQAGLNAHGVALGDNVVAVDRTFKSGALRIDARVTKISGSLLDTSDMTLTIGNIAESITGQFGGLSYSLNQLTETVDRSQQWQATADYVAALIGRLNDEANATGGWTYITQGAGIRTYSVPVSDPLDGAEAKAAVATGNGAVVEIKGGTIRIANSLTQAGDWDWKTVFTSGHVAADMITAVNLTAGYIGNADGSGYWDLDTGVMYRGSEMELLLSETSLAVTRGYAYSANSMTSNPGSMYLICFTSSQRLAPNQYVRLWAYRTGTNVSTWLSPRMVSDFGDGTYRYAVVVSHLDGVSATTDARFCINWSGGTVPGSYTLTDIRVYEYPITSPGSIVFESTGDSDRDVIKTVVSGGRVSTAVDGNESFMTPGVLQLSSIEADSEVKMLNGYRGVRYNSESDLLLLGNTTQFSGSTATPMSGNVLFDIANNELDINTEIGAYQLRSHSSISDWFTVSTNNASVSASSLEEWGPLRKFSLTLSLTSSITLNSNNAAWFGSIVIGTFATGCRPPNYKVFHGYAPSGSNQYVTELSFYAYNGQLRLFHVAQPYRTASAGMTFASGTTFYINDIY